MTLLKTKEYIDLVELSNFVHENYGWPPLGSTDGFHRAFSEVVDLPGNDTMVYYELLDGEDLLESDRKVVEVFRQLIKDGHLPNRYEFEVYVWW